MGFGLLRNAICRRNAQPLYRFYSHHQFSTQGTAVDKMSPFTPTIGNDKSIDVTSGANLEENSQLLAAKSMLSGNVLPTIIRDNITVESIKFPYYRKMGGNPIQQSPLNLPSGILPSGIRFYSSLSHIISTPKTLPMEKVCCQSYHTDKPGTLSEPSIKAMPTLLSPHLPIYAPQLTSTFSIFHRISMATLTTILLSFYLLYLKMGLICLTFENFYQFFLYASKLSLISVEIAGLAALSFLALSARPLFLKR